MKHRRITREKVINNDVLAMFFNRWLLILFLALWFCVSLTQTLRAEDESASSPDTPRVLFMIAEQNIGKEHFLFWWGLFDTRREFTIETTDMSVVATKLKELFIENGIRAVDEVVYHGDIEISNAFTIADLTDDGARTVGRMVDADVVLKGKAIVTKGKRVKKSDLDIFFADVTATAVSVDDGAIIGAATGHGVARHLSPIRGANLALEKAAADAAVTLIDQIQEKWGKR